MALNSSWSSSTMVNPPVDGFSNHLLSSSMSSFSPSVAARQPASSISRSYRQASTLFLTRRLPEALSTILPLITPPAQDGGALDIGAEPAPVAVASRTTRIKVWSLYLTILNAIVELDRDEGKDAFGIQDWKALCGKVGDGGVWEEVVQNGYHGVEGSVDSDVVINLATLLLAHAESQHLNQKRLENYLAASQMPNLDLSGKFPPSASPRHTPRYRSPAKSASGAETPRDLNSSVKILELYTLHVLQRNNEWDYAREFISCSPILDEERREAFLQALQSLREEQQLTERRRDEDNRKREEEVQREIEQARKLRIENEEKESRRIAEARAKRAGSEVDYGVESTPSNGASSKGRTSAIPSSLRPSSGPKQPQAPRTRARPKVTPPASLMTRAGFLMSNIGALIEQVGKSMQSRNAILRILLFIATLLVMFGRRGMRERIARLLRDSWDKVRATAGMGVKISYI